MKVIRLKESDIQRMVKRVLNEQIEPTTITSKELLKLGKKEGWESDAGVLPISQFATLSDTFTVIDGRGGHIAGAKLDADAKLRKSGIKQKRTFVIQKEEGNNVLVKYVMITK
jgi:hypothetical protein